MQRFEVLVPEGHEVASIELDGNAVPPLGKVNYPGMSGEIWQYACNWPPRRVLVEFRPTQAAAPDWLPPFGIPDQK